MSNQTAAAEEQFSDYATYRLIFEHDATGEEVIVEVYGADGIVDTIQRYEDEYYTYRGYASYDE